MHCTYAEENAKQAVEILCRLNSKEMLKKEIIKGLDCENFWPNCENQ